MVARFAIVLVLASAGSAWADDADVIVLTRRAQVAAAGGNCKVVAMLGERVKAAEPGYYATRFIVDPTIGGCREGVTIEGGAAERTAALRGAPEARHEPPGPPRWDVTAGIGSLYGGVGLAGEIYLGTPYASVVAGMGWMPDNFCNGAGTFSFGGAAIRGFTPGVRHRGFAALSYSQTSSGAHITATSCETHSGYGAGASAGYQFTGFGGATFVVAGGAGSDRSLGTVVLIDVGVGFTWR